VFTWPSPLQPPPEPHKIEDDLADGFEWTDEDELYMTRQAEFDQFLKQEGRT
jgi:hypothetical protein